MGLLIGLVLLPLLNAPFDWASTGLTRWLLRKNLDLRGAWRLLVSAMDALAALGLLVGLAGVMVVALEAFNAAAGHPVVDVAGTIADIRAYPSEGRHFWVYFTLFSTLAPTMLHAALAVLGLITFVWPPQLRGRMKRWIGCIEKDEPEAGWAEAKLKFFLAAQVMLAIVLVMAGFFVLVFLVLHILGAGGAFADGLLWLDRRAQEIFVH